MSDFLGALVCMKHVLSRSHPPQQSHTLQSQVIQSVHPIHLPDAIFNKIVQKFVKTKHPYKGEKCFSRAITGEPICAIIITDKEPWIAAITRSVKVEWPAYDISDERILKKLVNFRNMYMGYPQKRLDLTDINKATKEQAQNRSPYEPNILRNTEGRDFLVFPLLGQTLSFKNGFRIQMTPTHYEGISPLERGNQYQHRVSDVFTLKTLSKLWEVYTTIEQDPTLYEKYIKGDIVGEPIDHQNPLAVFHATLWKKDFSGWCGTGCILPVGADGQPYKKETRISIPTPSMGERIPYKHERTLLSTPRKLLEKTKA